MFNRKTILLACFCALSISLMMFSAADANDMGKSRSKLVKKTHPFEKTHAGGDSKPTTCSTCHQCENPTRKEPCLNSCPRFEGHFSSDLLVDDGPDIVIIDQLADLYRPVVFAHKLHAEMSNMTGGCENCHHFSEQTGSIPACVDCHDADPALATLGQPSLKGAYHRQCINCHMDWSHENACGFCHEQVEGSLAAAPRDTTDIIGIPHPLIQAQETYVYNTTHDDGPLVTFHHVDHVDKFGLECSDCHRGDSCSRCHSASETKTPRINHVSTCCTCHDERDCGLCHSEQTQASFEHKVSTGWDLKPFHDEMACTVCHGQPDTFKHPESTCTDCHIHWEDGSFDHAVTGVILDDNHIEEDCSSCHMDMDMSVAPSCTDCHDEPMFPDQIPGRRVKN